MESQMPEKRPWCIICVSFVLKFSTSLSKLENFNIARDVNILLIEALLILQDNLLNMMKMYKNIEALGRLINLQTK